MLKAKVVVFDLTGNAMNWLDMFGNEEHLEVCEIVTMEDNSPIKITELPMFDSWDYLFVFEEGLRDTVDELLRKLRIPEDKIIYPLDIEKSLSKHIAESMYMFKGPIYRYVKYLSYEQDGDIYAVVGTSEECFMNLTTDKVILPTTYVTGTAWSQDEMELFYEMSNKYYEFRVEQNIFCDIGANIGTTCIYFKKKIDRDIRILAFEPSKKNYKMLRVNAILNDLDLSTDMFIPMGLSDEKSEGVLEFAPSNPGASSLMVSVNGVSENGIQLIKFDDWIEQNEIDIKKIKYFWIDVEGFEGRFLKGARKTLSQIEVPIIMEFVPCYYMEKEGEFELLMGEIESQFSSYINVQHPEEGVRPVHELWCFQNNVRLEMDIFLMK